MKRRGTMSKIFRSTKNSELSAAPVNGFSEQSSDRTVGTDPEPRELARRSNYGLEVTLLWHPARVRILELLREEDRELADQQEILQDLEPS